MKKLILFLALLSVLLVSCTTGTPEPAAGGSNVDVPTPAATLPPIGEPTIQPVAGVTSEPSPEPQPLWISYVGQDNNLWMIDFTSRKTVQLTGDAAAPETGDDESISYCCSAWSSDGKLLAYQRQVGSPANVDGFLYRFELWVYEVETGNHRQLLEDQQTIGLSWKPLTHLLTYSLPARFNYFTGRGQVDANLATGIWAIDFDQDELPFELVAPQGGYTLVHPAWSVDGRFISFQELIGMEGSGNFAFFDTESLEYVSWGEPIGLYDWSSDSMKIVYDYLTYTANGTERIFQRERSGGNEQMISPDFETGYAFMPRYSPQGDTVAYLAPLKGPETEEITLYIQSISGGEPISLGEYVQASDLTWLPDGKHLLLSFGQWGPERQVAAINVESGSVEVLANGYQPSIPEMIYSGEL